MGTTDQKIDPWSFLTPFTFELWYTILGTTFIVAVMICLVDKLSPYGHHGKRVLLTQAQTHWAQFFCYYFGPWDTTVITSGHDLHHVSHHQSLGQRKNTLQGHKLRHDGRICGLRP